jgi:hypothetical protein
MQLTPLASSLGCKFFHDPPLCVIDSIGQIYYVVHKLQFLSKVAIYLGVHNHPIASGKCKEFLVETRRLITYEVICMPNVKTYMISFSASKTFLARHLLNDYNDDTMELHKGEYLEHIQNKL